MIQRLLWRAQDIVAHELQFKVYPNPANDYIDIEYQLENATQVQLSLYSVLGEKIADFDAASDRKAAGNQKEVLALD